MHPFSETLLNWHKNHIRELPWKNTKDPYVIWVSEIILQQTRVAQGTPYFLRFIKKFPDVFSLAEAPEDEVLKEWEGLGYYSRARNLHQSAKKIAFELNGKFPDKYQDILALKGVGPYTAAAISSFAFNLPYAVVDGNVIRVLSRYWGMEEPVDTTDSQKKIRHLAQELLPPDHAAEYNQAIMNFGAMICTPDRPGCLFCPFQSECQGYLKNMVHLIPVKSKKTIIQTKTIHYGLFIDAQTIWISKRKKGIWKGLYELPQILSKELEYKRAEAQEIFGPVLHILTHRRLKLFFYLYKSRPEDHKELQNIPITEWSNYPFPKPIHTFLSAFINESSRENQ